VTRNWALAVFVLLALAPGPASAAQPSADEPYAFATLDNGAFVGFALLRTQTDAARGSIGEVAFPRSNSVSRVLVDQGSGRYFGYRLEVEPVSSGKKFRVAVKPLGKGIEKELKRHRACESCPQLAPLGQLPRYPAPRMVGDGDLFMLDLLRNPSTGERIVDAVRLSSKTISSAAMHASAARLTESLVAVHRAEVFTARKNYGAAVKEYQRALAINANDAVVRNRLGVCYQHLRLLDQAQKEYKEAIRINPAHAEAWNNLGTIQHSRGRHKDAIKSYKRAVSLQPKYASALRNMGVAYFAQRRYDAGFEAFQSAYRIDPRILDATSAQVVDPGGASAATQSFYFAKICAAAGQRDSALRYLEKAVAAGFREFGRVASDPDLRVLTNDPRYKKLLRDANVD
jgi:Tfp pilus assembly protein PilF